MFVPAARVVSLDREPKTHTKEEHVWLENARQTIDGNGERGENISWAAFHASHQPSEVRAICPYVQFPIFIFICLFTC